MFVMSVTQEKIQINTSQVPWGIGQITIGERIYVRKTQIRG